MWSYSYSDYLAHYGVLGMKWGVRRARKASEKAAMYKAKANNYTGSNSATRTKLLAKSTKYTNKAQRITAKHKAYAGKAYNYTKNQSTGKALVKSYLLGGTYGALKYNEARASGASRGKAALEGILYNYGNLFTGGALSVAEPRISAKNRR